MINPPKIKNYGRRLMQPRYWPHIIRLAATRLSRTPPDLYTGPEAQSRCEAIAVEPSFALQSLQLASYQRRSMAAEWPNRIAQAEARIGAVTTRMGGAADLDLLYTLCCASGSVRVLETGVAYGWSSLAILSAIATRPGCRLVSVDLPYLGANLDDLVGLAVPQELRPCWTLLRGADRQVLPKAILATSPVDLAHYDSDKSYQGRRWAYPLMWRALRPGGILISDDVQNNLAFFDFAEETGAKPFVVRAANTAKFVAIAQKSH